MRLDIYLKEKGFFESREKARAAIAARAVLVNGSSAKKASYKVQDQDKIEIIEKEEFHYVSRAALKLLHAKREFSINFKNKTVIDIGSSTGGFSQVALEDGAKKIYAVDVGRNQMHDSLKYDERLTLLEQRDARDLSKRQVKDKIDILVSDLSFISVFKVLPFVLDFLKNNAELIILFKPQFEVGKENLNKGIVKSEEASQEALALARERFQKLNLKVLGCTKSPIKGKEGNTEYLFYLKKI